MVQMTKQNSQLVVGYPTERIDPLRLIAHLPIQPYHELADFRCGSGHLTIPLAKHLFSGKVYASDPDSQALKELKGKVAATHLGNVVILTEKQQKSIRQDTLDGALMAFTLSSVKDREAPLKSVLRLLKRGAWLAVLEWHDKKTTEGPPVSQRIGEDTVVDLARKVGFRFSQKRNLDGLHYLMILRK